MLITRRLPLDADAINRAEAATVLGVGEALVARLRREGLLSEVRGGRCMYSRAEVEAFAADPWLNGVGAGTGSWCHSDAGVSVGWCRQDSVALC